MSWSANTSQNTLVFCVMSSKVRPFAQKWFASAAYTDISNRGKRQALEMIVALKLLIHLRVRQCSHLLMNCKYYICFHDGNRPYLVKGNDLITAWMLHMWWNGCLAQLMAQSIVILQNAALVILTGYFKSWCDSWDRGEKDLFMANFKVVLNRCGMYYLTGLSQYVLLLLNNLY